MKDITDVWYQLRNERRLKKDCTDSSATELGTDQGRERGVRRREKKGEKREGTRGKILYALAGMVCTS
jgi:hypothetical protein